MGLVVGLGVGLGVRVSVGLGAGVWVRVGLGVCVGVRVTVAVGVLVEIGVLVAVQVGVAVGVGLATGRGAVGVGSSMLTLVTVGLTRAGVGSTVAVISSGLGVGPGVTGGGCDDPGQGRRIKKSATSSTAPAATMPPMIVGDSLRFGAGPGGEMATESSPFSAPVAAL